MFLYTDAELARLLLLRLLWAHDRAGVSMGRSLRNILAALATGFLPKVSGDTDALNVDDILAEATRRPSRKFYQQELFHDNLELMSNERIATLLIHKLHDWYAQDEASHNEPLGIEREILTGAMRLLCPWPDELLGSFPIISLVDEAERRYNATLSRNTLW
ncbi:MAG: hypothetical protein Q8P71_00130 [bacterium]|nr:hypothetical protein [bacterium]